MIDEARTLELFGYTSDSLLPNSHKKICAVCDGCGKIRELRYYQYHDLCHKCAMTGENNAFFGKKLSDETRQKISDAHKGKKLSDEHKRKISDAKKNPSDETRQKISDAKKNPSDETRQKLSEAHKGEKNYNWQGGTSFEPYCQKFNEAFKESIREKFGRMCFLCPKTEVENGRKLSVHHVNYDKNCLCDDSKCEFVPLCDSCHGKTNGSREYWENLIIDKLKDNSQLLDQFRNK